MRVKLDCRGVNDVIGVPISIVYYGSATFEVPTGVVGDEGGTFFPCFSKASNWDFVWESN
jgi:hypothetical protein